ncbi:MAG: Coenzyme F420 hydrogenase/dehydrogenase, beta subunit C-terminal domain [Ruminococcus sp.]|nr:Coenzyme F420 hydrogenase/dehydrogenase, beta subunit C-terminal domain [Ruminococcus sp.]
MGGTSESPALNGWACFGASFDEHFNVVHQSADSIDGCEKFRGSKYVASDMTCMYPELTKALKEQKYVLFSGTPCQVNAIRKYIGFRNLPSEKFYAIDIICHGTPNQKLWKDYVSWLEEKNGAALKNFSFRYKGTRWRKYPCMAEFSNGIVKKNTQDVRMFTTLYFTGLAYRECCYQCKFANMNCAGDLTIGDFWGFENVMPKTAAEWRITAKDGVNLVIVNTKKGRYLIDTVIDDAIKKRYRIAECKSDDYVKYQTNLQHSVERNSKVDLFRNDYRNYGFEYIIKKYGGYNTKGKLRFMIQKIAHETGLIYLVKK